MRYSGGGKIFEKVMMEEWDRLSDSERDILFLGADKGIAFVKVIGRRENAQ